MILKMKIQMKGFIRLPFIKKSSPSKGREEFAVKNTIQ
jgi:hypothetical protein